MTITPNTPAPDFTLPDQDGKEHTLADYRGKWVVLYFYPKDMTPGCTVEAEGFRDAMEQLEANNIAVLGVSADSSASHKTFCDKHDLNFTLLSDEDRRVIENYDVKKETGGTKRETFLINPEGIIVKHFANVTPKDHPQEVLEAVRELSQ